MQGSANQGSDNRGSTVHANLSHRTVRGSTVQKSPISSFGHQLDSDSGLMLTQISNCRI